MANYKDIAIQIELHSVEGIKKCLSEGLTPNDISKAQLLIYALTSYYSRSPRFKDCVKVFVDNGLAVEDKTLLSVLLDDAASLELLIKDDPQIISKKYTLRAAYTPFDEVTLLHICAEFNHVSCAEVLVNYGADINAKAGVDANNFGGQTPIFHTVNQNGNQSADMLNFLLSKSADLSLTLTGIVWGRSYEWETLMPSVNPISYAMMGLLPQVHRDEVTISKVVATLLRHQYGIDYSLKNVPCAYLKK